MRRLLVYKNGEVDAAMRGELGCYETYFARALAAQGLTDLELEVHRGFAAPLHRLSGYDGVILSGSPRSLVEGQAEPWMSQAQEFVRRVAAQRIPILGVCFGHQLVASAFGATVRRNPAGWEAGTHAVRLTAEAQRDPLFAGVHDEAGDLTVNQSHRDDVAAPPPGAVLLAGSARCPVQALAIGDHIRTVQFHPEFDAVVMRRLIRMRHDVLDEDARAQGRAQEGAQSLLQQVRDTPAAARVLGNWLRAYV